MTTTIRFPFFFNQEVNLGLVLFWRELLNQYTSVKGVVMFWYYVDPKVGNGIQVKMLVLGEHLFCAGCSPSLFCSNKLSLRQSDQKQQNKIPAVMCKCTCIPSKLLHNVARCFAHHTTPHLTLSLFTAATFLQLNISAENDRLKEPLCFKCFQSSTFLPQPIFNFMLQSLQSMVPSSSTAGGWREAGLTGSPSPPMLHQHL